MADRGKLEGRITIPASTTIAGLPPVGREKLQTR